MKKELQQKIYDDFPGLFRQRNLPMNQTCMCWGIDCGDGWYQLIYDLCTEIMRIDPSVQATQVKEKLGGLRFYVTGSNGKICALINKAEILSENTCENCGRPAIIQSVGGWVFTRCEECM